MGELEQSWSRTEIQGAQFTHAVSLAATWRYCGVLPEITIGHSLGEVAAAYVAGTISLPDAVALVGARATVVDRLTGRYAMAVLGAGAEEAESVLADAPGWLEVSAVNGPSSTVVSGDHDAVAAAVQLAGRRGIFTHQLSVDYPGHTSALRQLRTPLIELIPDSAFRRGDARFVGSTFGTEVDTDIDFSEYWYENLCGTVRFDRAVRYAQKAGIDTFVELSAHPSLLYPLADIVDEDPAVIVGSGHRDKPITDSLSASIAAVATADPGSPWVNAMPGGYPVAAAEIPERADAGRASMGDAGTADRYHGRSSAYRRRRGLAAGDIPDDGQRNRLCPRIFRRGCSGRVDSAADRRRRRPRRLRCGAAQTRRKSSW